MPYNYDNKMLAQESGPASSDPLWPQGEPPNVEKRAMTGATAMRSTDPNGVSEWVRIEKKGRGLREQRLGSGGRCYLRAATMPGAVWLEENEAAALKAKRIIGPFPAPESTKASPPALAKPGKSR
jgi:hypothetical protein